MANNNYPDSITLEGKEYKVNDTPELKQFFDTVVQLTATTEKTKLYADLNKAKNERENAVKETATLNTQLQDLLGINQTQSRAYEQMKREQEANKSGVVNSTAIAEAVEVAFKTHLPALLQPYLEPVNAIAQKFKTDSITTYRQERINAENGMLFPELVRGDSPDEIDRSLAESKKLWFQYMAPVIAKTNGAAPQQPQQPVVPKQKLDPNGYGGLAWTPEGKPIMEHVASAPSIAVNTPVYGQQPDSIPAIVPVVGSFNTPTATDIPDIKSMSPEEFAAARPSLYLKVKAAAEAAQNQSMGV